MDNIKFEINLILKELDSFSKDIDDDYKRGKLDGSLAVINRLQQVIKDEDSAE